MGSSCVLVFPKLSSMFFFGSLFGIWGCSILARLKQALIADMPIIQSYP